MIKRTLACLAVFGVMASGTLLAHHSLAGVYDMKKEAEVSGTLTSLKLVNPHGSLTLAVKKADGSTIDFVFLTGSATTLAQRGISKLGPNALKSGDVLTAKYIPAKDGSPLGFLRSITTADGRVLSISAGNPND
jgi:hypothetical protein